MAASVKLGSPRVIGGYGLHVRSMRNKPVVRKRAAEELSCLNPDTDGGKEMFEPLADMGFRSEFSMIQRILAGGAIRWTTEANTSLQQKCASQL